MHGRRDVRDLLGRRSCSQTHAYVSRVTAAFVLMQGVRRAAARTVMAGGRLAELRPEPATNAPERGSNASLTVSKSRVGRSEKRARIYTPSGPG